MENNKQHRLGLSRRIGSTVALGFVALLASLALGLASAGPAAAASHAVTTTSDTAALSPSEATAFVQRVVDLQTQAPSIVRPNGVGCDGAACGWIFTRAQTHTIWVAVVNKPINVVAAYCRSILTNVGASGLTYLCDGAANFLRSLTAPNNRCLLIGAQPQNNPPFFAVVVKYTTVACA